MRGRPKTKNETKEIKREAAKKEVENKTEESTELAELRAEIEALKQIALQKIEAPKAAQKKKDKSPLWNNEANVCCNIECRYQEREAARQEAFYNLVDEYGGVTLTCPLSGLGVRFKNLDAFPSDTYRVPSNKVNSYFVRYKITK